MRDDLKGLILCFAIIGVLAGLFVSLSVFHILWSLHARDKRVMPYASYTRLVNLASGFDDYKKQNGVWPADIIQLVNVRPDLGNDTNDAYGHAVILIPYSEKAGYGELISYGRDGKPGGDNKFDRDIEIRFPTETETNAQWNKQVSERFKSRVDRGLPGS
jgi:hypothetical protein